MKCEVYIACFELIVQSGSVSLKFVDVGLIKVEFLRIELLQKLVRQSRRNFVVDAMVRAGSTDPKVYGPLLFKTDYQGVTTKVGFEADGELKNPAMSLYQYKDGKKVSLN